MEFLDETEITISCIACAEDTKTVTKCCKASLCSQCVLEWLRRKRECMHCKTDQLPFEEWVEQYRDDALVPPPVEQPQLLMEGVLYTFYDDVSDNESIDEDSLRVFANAIANHYLQSLQREAFLELLNAMMDQGV